MTPETFMYYLLGEFLTLFDWFCFVFRFHVAQPVFTAAFLAITLSILALSTFLKPKPSPLIGKTVLITGAAGGLGRALAKKLDKLGCRLVLWDTNYKGLTSLVAKLNPSTLHVYQRVDVSSESDILQNFTKSPIQRVDIVIANAGIVHGKPIDELSTPEFNHIINTNLSQHFYLYKLFVPLWENAPRSSLENSKLPPTLVMVSSVAGLIPLTRLADYCTSKFGLVGFAEGIRLELAKRKSLVHTLLVLPFLIDTKMFYGISLKFPASLIMRPLNKYRLAGRIITGIENREDWIVLPWFLRFLPLILVLPISLRNFIYKMIGEPTYMDNFKGRAAATLQ